MSTLIICEKANAADKIAYFLSSGNSKLTRRGRVKVHNFSMGGEEYSVVGLRGHVVSFDYEKKYNNWKDTELKKLIWAEPIRQATAVDIVSTIQSIRPKKVIIATDYDREGELIGVEALDIIDWPPEKAKRAKFSALTGEEIRTAFQNLSDVDTKLADAGMARQYIDLAWGAVLTRFVSLTTGRMGRDFLSIGRVQSPTLALIVDRENEILAFVPKPFWEITALLGKDNINVQHTKNPFWEEMEAIKSSEKAKQAEKAKVEDWSKRDEYSRPPPPFNTTMFITEATKLGLGARQAMDIAEDLYTDGWISYPRTDNTVYPRSLSLKGVLKKLSQGEFKKEAEELLAQDRIRATRGRTQTTDHPPIYPVRGATSEQLKGTRWKVYELVARRFMATVAPDAILEKTEGKMDLNGEKFQISGKFIKYAGWTAYYPYFRFDEIVLPSLKKGQMLDVNKVSKARKHTRPPPRYSQGSLIQKMEDLNLGTKSTRHEIIQKLFERGYVRKPLVPTSTGMALIEMLREGAEEMTRHHMTATLEDEMTAIT
ncbi:MAG: DNA topoisomerase I, partial [Candidatus Thermoplasmatota archaeon]|nr:DNA topoisomerase I [Candidatus Thermoplasmatota archaeon]